MAPKDSQIAKCIFKSYIDNSNPNGIFYVLPLTDISDNKTVLLSILHEIINTGWHRSRRLDKDGNVMEYRAQNGGGYTLEALMEVTPNGKSEPDFRGWELKGFSKEKITLMTPEPDGGFYGKEGVEAFVRKYGHETNKDTIYFTGVHKVNIGNDSTGMTLKLIGFDSQTGIITDPAGGIYLLSDNDDIAATWSFAPLIKHWGRKHSLAVYVKYLKQILEDVILYKYTSPVWLGEGTDFSYFLKAMFQGSVIYDPASKVQGIGTGHTKVKARSQFRINFKQLNNLYKTFEPYSLD